MTENKNFTAVPLLDVSEMWRYLLHFSSSCCICCDGNFCNSCTPIYLHRSGGGTTKSFASIETYFLQTNFENQGTINCWNSGTCGDNLIGSYKLNEVGEAFVFNLKKTFLGIFGVLQKKHINNPRRTFQFYFRCIIQLVGKW